MASNAPRKPTTPSRGQEDPALVEQAIRDEAAESWAAPSVGVVTPAQTKGGIAGAAIGGLIGLVIGFALSVPALVDLDFWLRLLVIGGIATVAGSTIGGLLGGFFNPDREGETGRLPGEGPRSTGETRSGQAE